MRNQIDAASRVGLRSLTVNSASTTTVDALAQALHEDAVDLVLVSPERLANPEFGDKIMPIVGSRPGLIVIDEVHCISDWGHDFRPDYRRIVGLLDRLVGTVPVLGCTATANDRVVVDAATQLGAELTTFRGPLRRDGLALTVLELPHPSDRLAWLATNLEALPGSGIIYCLTVADVLAVHDWLHGHGYNVLAYTGDTDGDARVAGGASAAGQRGQGTRRHHGARHGLRQARSRLRRALPSAGLTRCLLPASRTCRPRPRRVRRRAPRRERGPRDPGLLHRARLSERRAGRRGSRRARSLQRSRHSEPRGGAGQPAANGHRADPQATRCRRRGSASRWTAVRADAEGVGLSDRSGGARDRRSPQGANADARVHRHGDVPHGVPDATPR